MTIHTVAKGLNMDRTKAQDSIEQDLTVSVRPSLKRAYLMSIDCISCKKVTLFIVIRATSFELTLKEILRLLWFRIATLCDRLKILVPLSQPIRSKTKTNRDLPARVFPHLAPATCIWFEFWLFIELSGLVTSHWAPNFNTNNPQIQSHSPPSPSKWVISLLSYNLNNVTHNAIFR